MALIALFLIIALVYSSVGFGGGSSYTAILTFFEVPYQWIPLLSLSCNIVVTLFSTVVFHQKSWIPYQRVRRLFLGSIPFSFVGGLIPISPQLFYPLLGCSLIIAALFMFSKKYFEKQSQPHPWTHHPLFEFGLGAILGLLSGLVGIGGGIYLSPILLLFKWDQAKVIAATASLFILVNSFFGFIGQLIKVTQGENLALVFQNTNYLYLPLAVLIGASTGNYLLRSRFSNYYVIQATACLVFLAGIRLLLK